jgi:hypothetical protein
LPGFRSQPIRSKFNECSQLAGPGGVAGSGVTWFLCQNGAATVQNRDRLHEIDRTPIRKACEEILRPDATDAIDARSRVRLPGDLSNRYRDGRLANTFGARASDGAQCLETPEHHWQGK